MNTKQNVFNSEEIDISELKASFKDIKNNLSKFENDEKEEVEFKILWTVVENLERIFNGVNDFDQIDFHKQVEALAYITLLDKITHEADDDDFFDEEDDIEWEDGEEPLSTR